MAFDVAVIGAGVVGCAVARDFARHGASTVLIERGRDILSGASKANSAILHTGFDAPPGSVEAGCMRVGRERYLAERETLNLPLLRTNAIMIASNADERDRFGAVARRATENGCPEPASLDAARLRARVPGLAEGMCAGLLIPGEHVIDPWSAPLAYARDALAHGAEFRRETTVLGGELTDGLWRLASANGTIEAGLVVNCAGLYGDIVEAIARPSPFRIRPRRGEFIVLDKSAAPLLQTILLPIPTPRTKGMVLCPTIFGNLLVGPTAEDQEDRQAAPTTSETLVRLRAHAAAVLPALSEHGVVACYAGLRPATDDQDYQIEALPARQWITVGGIRSTGLTAALGIARLTLELAALPQRAVTPRSLAPVPNLAEHLARDWQRAGVGEIVCHCERVTRREIDACLDDVLPPGDLGGLKRRTRAMLGRCQGFFCAARVFELVSRKRPEAVKPCAVP